MLFDNITRLAMTAIGAGAAEFAQQKVESIKTRANQWRPTNIATDGYLRRQYYKGKHKEHFMQWVAKVYPEAAANNEIHPVTVNFLRTWCEHDADVYRAGQPKRTTDSGDNEDAEKRMAALAKAARLDVRLPDTEVKSHAGRQMFVKVMRNPKTDKLDVTRHWPDLTWVAADDAAPVDINESHAVMFKLREGLYEVWEPRIVDDKRGWMMLHARTEGPNAGVEEKLVKPYFGRLPIAVMYTDDPDESIYLDDDSDLVENANNYMLGLTDSFHIARSQAHNPLYTTGAEEVKANGGPGGITELPQGATMGAVQLDAQIDQVRALMNDYAAVVALSRNQPQRSYTTNPEPLNSALALRADNEIAEQKRPTRVALMAMFDRDLMRILDEVDRLMPPQKGTRVPGKPLPDDIVSVFPRAPTVEDPQQKQVRLEHAQGQGWISKERAATEAGYYPSEELAAANMPTTPPPAVVKVDVEGRTQGMRGPPPGIVGGSDG